MREREILNLSVLWCALERAFTRTAVPSVVLLIKKKYCSVHIGKSWLKAAERRNASPTQFYPHEENFQSKCTFFIFPHVIDVNTFFPAKFETYLCCDTVISCFCFGCNHFLLLQLLINVCVRRLLMLLLS